MWNCYYEVYQVEKSCCYLPYYSDVSHNCNNHGTCPSLSPGMTEVGKRNVNTSHV
jgi:hypothetical protein